MAQKYLLSCRLNSITLYGDTVLYVVHVKRQLKDNGYNDDESWENTLMSFTERDIVCHDPEKKVMTIAGEDDEPLTLIAYHSYRKITHQDKHETQS